MPVLSCAGYIVSTESKLYYLQSRYYDPEMGRFINADVFASTGQGLLGNNMFAYCNNNPVSLTDNAGCVPAWFCDDPLHQTVADFLDWYWTSNEDEQDGYGNLTVNAKLKRTVTALGNSVEFVAGVGLGISTGFEFSKYINVEAGLYYDLIRVEYIDGRFTAYQYAYEGITANFFFISSGSPRELYRPISSYPTKWQPYESVEKMSYGVSAYLFGGGTFAVNWDVLGLLNDLDEIWR